MKTSVFNPIRPRISHTPTFYFEGFTKNSKKLTAIALADNERANFFSKMAYAENPQKKDLGRLTYERVPTLVRSFNPDIVFVDAHWSFSGFLLAKGFFVLPYLQCFIDISDSIDSTLGRPRTAKTTRKKIRRLDRSKLTCRITRDPATLKEFYYSMYVPHILERHKEDAKLVSFEECYRLSQMGGLMLLMLNGVIISGAVVVPKGEVLYIPLDGINFTNQDTKEIAVFALTYFIIKWAKEQGFRQIDHGASKPFLRDGVSVYKRRWGMSVKPMGTPDARICAIKFCKFDDAAKDFLQSNPFVFLEGAKLYGLAMSSSNNEVLKDYYASGISGIVNLTNGCDHSLSILQSKTLLGDILDNNLALNHLRAALAGTGTDMSYFDFVNQELNPAHGT